MWGRMSTVCGTRGSAGPGDDKHRKWVTMDEWRKIEGEKNEQRRKEAERSKEGTGRCPSGLLQVVCPQLGQRGEGIACVCMCMCVCVALW